MFIVIGLLRYIGGRREILAINYALLYGVRAALALSRLSVAEVRKLHNPAVIPRLMFVDLGGQGYALVTVIAYGPSDFEHALLGQ